MASPDEHLILVDRGGNPIATEKLVQKLRSDHARVLADDQVGLVIYVGDLDIYELVPMETGEFLARHVTQISRPRFPVQILRRQIEARVFSVTADAVFVVREGAILRKVRAENLKPGMVLATGERVFR